MLEAMPTAATLADIYRDEGGNPANATGYTVGSTREPVRFQLPAVSLEVRESADDNALAHRAVVYRRLGVGHRRRGCSSASPTALWPASG